MSTLKAVIGFVVAACIFIPLFLFNIALTLITGFIRIIVLIFQVGKNKDWK